MSDHDRIFNKIAEALLADYSSVYYIDAVTNEYHWYSADSGFTSLQIQHHGTDFFHNLIIDADKVVYEEDKHIFMRDMQKENLMRQVKAGTMQSIEYRLMIDGVPTWHALKLIRGVTAEDDYIILGVLNIDKEVRERQQVEHEREIFNQIAATLAGHYDTIYYIDIDSNNYFEFSSTDRYKSLNVPPTGEDFFEESAKNLRKYIHPDDRARAVEMYKKETMLRNLRDEHLFTSVYRLIVQGMVMHIRASMFRTSDGGHFIICIENINAEIETRKQLEESRRMSVTYGQIAESLASNYYKIFYVRCDTNEYTVFTGDQDGMSAIGEEQGDFFMDGRLTVEMTIHNEDRDRMLMMLKKDYMISTLESKKQYSLDYRYQLEDEDGRIQYRRITITLSGDRSHFIIAVENISEEKKREKEQIQALNLANELARRDELTGIKNMTAFHELENTMQESIESGTVRPFSVVVCDLNGLKHVNDTQGHKAGDEFIRSACRLICNVFAHSPVFRIGGDEFAAVMAGTDQDNREDLIQRLKSRVIENLRSGEGPVVASGMATFDPERDKTFTEVFERADSEMYEEKTRLKEGSFSSELEPASRDSARFPEERKKRLDELFEALSVVAEGNYIYLCDMKYDWSRWSKTAVDAFNLPSEYIYGAGAVWEEHIHPEDRETYHNGINDIFSGNAREHDMQYRAMKINGEYDLCTCRGLVIRDPHGEPEYFGGSIRNHGEQTNVDNLTGLRNMYGFFEDLETYLLSSKPMKVIMLGISKFSEVNEMYGYHFGNTVLQKVGRFLFEHTGNLGGVYRLDGTKFAIISSTATLEGLKTSYAGLRKYFRESFKVNGKTVMLELNAGLLSVDSFSIDHQTVYACLTFAYMESKLRRQGNLVEFYNDLNDTDRRRIEKLHAIRGSIMKGYRGFYLLYQPVVDSKTERFIGAEALLRWRNSEYGIVPPDHFIPILERDTLFPELGQWILRQAMQDALPIIAERPDFTVNVNLSYTQLERPDFAERVIAAIGIIGFPPENLCLEITERCRLLDMELLKNVITNLRGAGIKIALDDFGTGFSSVGVVKELPFDYIKIDRSFVKSIEDDDKERELIKFFAEVASTFGAQVCIEGIETSGMRDILQNYSVHSFQGYYYGRPLELGDLHILLDSKK